MYNKSVRYVNVAQFDLTKHEISRSIRRGQIFSEPKCFSNTNSSKNTLNMLFRSSLVFELEIDRENSSEEKQLFSQNTSDSRTVQNHV